MAITRDDVSHVAKLARLELTSAEMERMVRDLGRILGYVEELSQVDTRGIEPTAYVAVETAPFRPDAISPGVARDLALAEAPRQGDGAFAVPGYVDEG